MTVTIKIKLGNAEMKTPRHVSAALSKLADKWEYGSHFHRGSKGSIRDINGNTVGEWKVG